MAKGYKIKVSLTGQGYKPGDYPATPEGWAALKPQTLDTYQRIKTHGHGLKLDDLRAEVPDLVRTLVTFVVQRTEEVPSLSPTNAFDEVVEELTTTPDARGKYPSGRYAR